MDFAVVIAPNRRAGNILKRLSITNLLLAAAIGLVSLKTYEIWQQSDRRPLKKRDEGSPVNGQGSKLGPIKGRSTGTKVIVEKNLFDVKRGAGGSGKKAAVTQDTGEIEGLVLLGTIVAAGERFAIVKVPASSPGGRRGSGAGGGMRRLGLGDTVWGYTLAEIQADRVMFTKGSSEVELGLDFSRRSVNTQKPTRSKSSSKNRRRRR
jgi:hypothetical protein